LRRLVEPGLASLVGVEDFRPAVQSKRFFDRVQAEVDFHGDRDPPGKHPSAEPVQHGSQVDEAVCHWNVRDVHRPHLVWPHDIQTSQQIRVDLVPKRGFGGVRTPIQRLNAHSPHHRHDPLPPDRDAFAAQ